MTGFLQRLALRSAGLAAPENPAPLRLRPRSAFEPSSLMQDLAGAPLDVAAPPSLAASADDAPLAPASVPMPRRSREPATRTGADPDAARDSVTHRPARRKGGEQAEPSPERIADLSVATVRTPARAPSAVRPAPLRRGRLRPVPREDGAPSAQAAAMGDAPAPADLRAERPPAMTVLAEPRFAPPRGEIDLAPGPPVVADSRHPQRPSGADRSPPPVSLSIGRIDVEFVDPPAPAAAAPADPRRRGFADYARIRRGAPR